MGLIDRVVDRFRGGAPERPYECLHCGARLAVEYYTCPDCGSFSVDRHSISS